VHEWAGLGPDGVGVVLVLIVVGLLALALLWLVLNGPVPMASVVIGIVAIRRIRRAGPRGRGLPLAIAGLVLGALSLASSAVSLLILAVLSRPQVWP